MMRTVHPRRPTARPVLSFALVALWAGCTGNVAEDPVPGTGGSGGKTPGAGGSGGKVTMPFTPGGTGGAACTLTPGPGAARRLTNAEYASTIRDLLGEKVAVDVDALENDTRMNGFDNNRATLAVSTKHVRSFGAQADAIAAQVLGAPTRAAVLGCDPMTADKTACLTTIVDRIGRRAFRRAVAAGDRTALLDLAEAADGDPDKLASYKVVLSAILQAPSFLYKFETGVAEAGKAGVKRLTGHEVASRLSYFLWGTMPPDELLEAADRKELDTAAGVEAWAKAMLDDPRARGGLERFYMQLFQIYRLEDAKRGSTAFPAWTATMPAAMAEETRRFVGDVLWKEGGSFLDLLTAQHSFVDKGLAKLYGITAPATDWGRVDLKNAPRSGLLTQAGILTFTADTEVEAPIIRGSYVRNVILCSAPPPPPDGIPPPPVETADKTVRELLAGHSEGGCATCHKPLDLIGFGLERYDLVGAYREKDAQGRPLTGQGEIWSPSESVPFTGAVELGRKLREQPSVATCMSKHLLRYGLGRTEGADDACAISTIEAALRDAKYDLRAAIPAIVRSDLFRYVGGVQ